LTRKLDKDLSPNAHPQKKTKMNSTPTIAKPSCYKPLCHSSLATGKGLCPTHTFYDVSYIPKAAKSKKNGRRLCHPKMELGGAGTKR